MDKKDNDDNLRKTSNRAVRKPRKPQTRARFFQPTDEDLGGISGLNLKPVQVNPKYRHLLKELKEARPVKVNVRCFPITSTCERPSTPASPIQEEPVFYPPEVHSEEASPEPRVSNIFPPQQNLLPAPVEFDAEGFPQSPRMSPVPPQGGDDYAQPMEQEEMEQEHVRRYTPRMSQLMITEQTARGIRSNIDLFIQQLRGEMYRLVQTGGAFEMLPSPDSGYEEEERVEESEVPLNEFNPEEYEKEQREIAMAQFKEQIELAVNRLQTVTCPQEPEADLEPEPELQYERPIKEEPVVQENEQEAVYEQLIKEEETVQEHEVAIIEPPVMEPFNTQWKAREDPHVLRKLDIAEEILIKHAALDRYVKCIQEKQNKLNDAFLKVRNAANFLPHHVRYLQQMNRIYMQQDYTNNEVLPVKKDTTEKWWLGAAHNDFLPYMKEKVTPRTSLCLEMTTILWQELQEVALRGECSRIYIPEQFFGKIVSRMKIGANREKPQPGQIVQMNYGERPSENHE